MLPGMKSAPNMQLFLKKHQEGIFARAPPKYTVEDWNFANDVKLRMILTQQKLVERLTTDSRRVIDETTETTKDWQREVEHHMKERVTEIQFLCDELSIQKKTAMLENEALTTYRNRLNNAINFLMGKSLSICKQCLAWRENRIGVDLCDDEVDRELCRELKTIKGCQDLLHRTLKETEDQIRKLNAAAILLDEDLEFKYKSLLIDKKNIRLHESNHDLGEGLDLSKNICLYTLDQWQKQTYRNLEQNAKELTTASQMRGYIDLILQQVCEDMRNQTERTNLAFNKSISQIKHMKRCMEDKHKEIMANVMNVQQLLKVLQQEMVDKDRSMLLCRTRLSNRSFRPGLELACDIVQDSLNLELQALQVSMCKLKQKITENKAVLRYLLHVQLLQEEDINIKANTIKIDEVDCMTLRLALVYTNF